MPQYAHWFVYATDSHGHGSQLPPTAHVRIADCFFLAVSFRLTFVLRLSLRLVLGIGADHDEIDTFSTYALTEPSNALQRTLLLLIQYTTSQRTCKTTFTRSRRALRQERNKT
jgi:hypothetical protein